MDKTPRFKHDGYSMRRVDLWRAMSRTPTKAAIRGEERGLLERQRVLCFVGDRMAAVLVQCRVIEAIALIGSVAGPMRREVPRFAPHKQLRLSIARECKDVDIAVSVSRLDGLDELRRARGRVVGGIVAECDHGPAIYKIEFFLLEPATNPYLGRLCYCRQCPAGKDAAGRALPEASPRMAAVPHGRRVVPAGKWAEG
jgi:hypothetical protein